jgi:tRNA threonylcarbamoyl adenosine modification protein YeaZ
MPDPVLAIETSTPVCSVALYDGYTLRHQSLSGPGVHSVKVFEFVHQLLQESGLNIPDLSALLVSAGPGSYTGLRIGSSAAKGLLFGTSVPLYAIETLAAIAEGQRMKSTHEARQIHAVINARRTHLYHQEFETSEQELLLTAGKPALKTLSEIRDSIRPGDAVAGTGIQRLELENMPELSGKVQITAAEQALSAAHLIGLYHSGSPEFSRKVGVESFEPMYQPE